MYDIMSLHGLSGSGRKTKLPGGLTGIPSSAHYGDTLEIGWGSSNDSGVTYYMYVQFDNGDWNNIYTGTATNTNYDIPDIAYSKCKFRIRCCKLGSAFSVYVFSNECSLSQSPIPGPTKIIAGNETEGYYGGFNNLISQAELETLVNFSVSDSISLNVGDITWLKYIYHGKILFVADRHLRCGMSWNKLNNMGLVSGKNISIGNYNYKCRALIGNYSSQDDVNNADTPTEYDNLLRTLSPNDIHFNEKGAGDNADCYLSDFCELRHEGGAFVTRGAYKGSYSQITDITLTYGQGGLDEYNFMSYYNTDSGGRVAFAWRPTLELIQ